MELSAKLSSANLIVEQSRAEPSIIEPSGAELSIELSIEPSKPLRDEPTVGQLSAERSAELFCAKPIVEPSSIELSSIELSSTELSSTGPIVEQSGAEPSIERPRPLSKWRSVEQPSAEQSTELSSAVPIVEPLDAVPQRPLGHSLIELSSTEPIVEPTGAEPSIELPRPLSHELSTEQSHSELSAMLSSAELSSAEPIVEPPMPSSAAEPSVVLSRPSSAEVRGKWPRGKLLKTSSAEPRPKPKPSRAKPSAEPPRP